MKSFLFLFLFCLTAPAILADAGVLIPSTRNQPDPAILSLNEMAIDVKIDNGDAHVSIRQIFASHQPGVLEGNYIFALPTRATVSDFAVWDDVNRIPGVILERRRAEDLYASLKWQAIDPGLLQMGERGAEEANRSAVFTARIVPIPAFGTKRIEIEYHESIPVEDLKSLFAVPLRPDAHHSQVAGRLSITFELRSAHAIRDFDVVSKTYPLQIQQRAPNLVRGSFDGQNVTFSEDFAVRYAVDGSRGDQLQVIAHRDPTPPAASPADARPLTAAAEPGFFQASALIASGTSTTAPDRPRTIIALFDNSLSMQWEKLERSFRALEKLLLALRPSDKFNLILFNTEIKSFAGTPAQAGTASVEKALAFVRASHLRGGTDLQRGLEAALQQAAASDQESYVVLFSDGDATRGPIGNRKLSAWYKESLSRLAEARRPRTYVFAIGDDANLPLLKLLARDNGVLENVRSTEPLDFKLDAFLSKIGRKPVEALQLTAEPAGNFDLVYPLDATTFAGSIASWVGRYKQPQSQASFTARATRDNTAIEMRATLPLPESNLEHQQLPRTWAKARVDALLEKIEREGEDRASVDEIIRLSRRYKFVTPYTSFLAAPRAFLRPRLIRPGDPVLRVRTDASIVSVVALFPFGLSKKLRYLDEEDTWQTRFLAPVDMTDGTYRVRLLLRDRAGNVYRESKTFVIASKPPVVRVRLDKQTFRRGEAVRLRVSASETTRTVMARMYGVPAVSLRWDQRTGANTGEFFVPAHLPAGSYAVSVVAEDVAHNIGRGEVAIEVLP